MRLELVADCGRCRALCCVLPAFARSADFAIDKPAGSPCPKLDGYRCGIHATLRAEGFAGCVVFDCFGAGQHAVESGLPFEGLRDVHALVWHLTEAEQYDGRVAALLEEASGWTAVTPEKWERVTDVLLSVSEQARADVLGRKDFRGADLAGRRLTDLHGASLRGAVLLGADLRGADLRRADLTGADLRGASLHGADLTGAMWVTPAQLQSATGDAETRLPSRRTRPAHW